MCLTCDGFAQIIILELIRFEFSSIYETYLRTDTEDKFWLVNTNKLVRFYPGVDGLKTGYTEEFKYFGSDIVKETPLFPIIQLESQGMAENLHLQKHYFRHLPH